MKNKIINCDVDGVILDFNSAFNRYMNSLGIEAVDPDNYDYALKYGISDDLVYSHCESFSSSPNMESLEFIENSFNVINKLYDDKSVKVHFITSVSNDPSVFAARSKNILSKVNPDAIHAITCLGFLADKREFLQAHYTGSECWWIEDSVTNFKVGEDLGLRSLLMDQPYNRGYNTPNRVFSWKEIYDRITAEA